MAHIQSILSLSDCSHSINNLISEHCMTSSSAISPVAWNPDVSLLRVQSKSVTMLVTTTDAGADEAAARRHMHSAFADDAHLWFFEANCFQHQYHIMVLATLKLADDFLLTQTGRKLRYPPVGRSPKSDAAGPRSARVMCRRRCNSQ